METIVTIPGRILCRPPPPPKLDGPRPNPPGYGHKNKTTVKPPVKKVKTPPTFILPADESRRTNSFMRRTLAGNLRDIYNKDPPKEGDSTSESSSWDEESSNDDKPGLASIAENDSDEDIPSEEDEADNVRSRIQSFSSINSRMSAKGDLSRTSTLVEPKEVRVSMVEESREIKSS